MSGSRLVQIIFLKVIVLRWCVTSLVEALALGEVEIAEDVQLVERGEGDKDYVPDHQDDAILPIKLPAVKMCGEHKEDHGA